MSVHIYRICGIKGFGSHENDFTNLVTSIILGIEQSIVTEFWQFVRISEHIFEIVIVPPFMDFFFNGKDRCNISFILEANIRALEHQFLVVNIFVTEVIHEEFDFT